MIMTNRCFIVENPTTEENVSEYHVTANGLGFGVFKANIDRNRRKKICVISFDFRSNNNDQTFENEIFKEVFLNLAKRAKLPVCFKSSVLTENTKKVLTEIGAKEVLDVEHIWPDAFNIFKLEVE